LFEETQNRLSTVYKKPAKAAERAYENNGDNKNKKLQH
jgi:hypothetical protein